MTKALTETRADVRETRAEVPLVSAAGNNPDDGGDRGVLPAARLARIVSVREGVAYVEFDGDTAGPRPARTTVPLRNLKDEVLVVLVGDGRPVIVGQLYDSVPLGGGESEDADVVLKGRSVRIEADSEIVLISGRSRIHLDARGKATTIADQVVSRARGANKVQGGCVKLN